MGGLRGGHGGRCPIFHPKVAPLGFQSKTLRFYPLVKVGSHHRGVSNVSASLDLGSSSWNQQSISPGNQLRRDGGRSTIKGEQRAMVITRISPKDHTPKYVLLIHSMV